MQDLKAEIAWLKELILASVEEEKTDEQPFPAHTDNTNLGRFVVANSLSVNERITIALALACRVRPAFFVETLAELEDVGRVVTELYLLKNPVSGLILPTWNTARKLWLGNEFEKEVANLSMRDSTHVFTELDLLRLEHPGNAQIPGTEILIATDLALRHLLLNEPLRPEFSSSFPARPLTTHYTWDELVLPAKTNLAVREIEVWLEHANVLMQQWGDRPKIKRGFRALFHGPPGTGKSLTAALLGKGTGREVFRIDLSMVVSKYIGETEKNLARVLDMAEGKGWILFFDEADALFGKRTNVRDAHDRYANQEVSFLLQRIEDYDGLVILASNKKDNLDEAFTRRFQSIIHFPVPNVAEREQLWANSLPTELELSPEVDLVELAKRYDIAGGSIINVVGYATLMALNDGHGAITPQHLRDGVVKEYRKEGRNI